MTDLVFREYPLAELVQFIGSDEMICKAARVSTIGSESLDSKESSGLINYLMTNKHGSPFEHGSMTVLVKCPIFVSRELVRHRTLSFNEESGRYRELKPEFYIPHFERSTEQVGKPGNYKLVENPELSKSARNNIYMSTSQAWESYRKMLDDGVAREVARMALPVNIFTSLYVTGNPRAWMKFFELRTDENAMWEIRSLATTISFIFSELWPITWDTFDKNGRVSP